MTITLQAVNELIQSLESAGRERKYLELAKAYQQLTAENVGLKAAINAVNRTAEECEVNGDELKYVVEPSEFEALIDFMDETPATDRIVAEAEARGVEKAIAHLEKKFSNIGVQIMNLQWLADSLREGADK